MVRKGFVALFITGEKVGEGDEFSHLCGPSAVGALGNERDDGMVSLVHVAPSKHFVESCERFGSACENHEATHGASLCTVPRKTSPGLLYFCLI